MNDDDRDKALNQAARSVAMFAGELLAHRTTLRLMLADHLISSPNGSAQLLGLRARTLRDIDNTIVGSGQAVNELKEFAKDRAKSFFGELADLYESLGGQIDHSKMN